MATMIKRSAAVSVVAALLLVSLPGLVPAADAQSSALYEVTDPTGDVVLRANGQDTAMPAPAGPASTDSADLTALRIIEDSEQRLIFETQFVDLKAVHTNAEGGFQAYLHIWFRVDGSPVWYHLIIQNVQAGYANALDDRETGFPFAQFCITGDEDAVVSFGYVFDCYYQEAYAQVYYSENVVRAAVPKLSLLGMTQDGGERPGGIPKALPAGRELVDLKAEFVKPPDWVFISFGGDDATAYVDLVPDDGAAPAYKLATPAADATIRIIPETRMGVPQEPDWDPLLDPPMHQIGVAEGVPAALPLHVENSADGKRLVNLTTRFVGGGAGFDVKLAPTLEVPAGDARKLTLLIEPKGPVAYGEGPVLEVRGVALGHPDELSVARIQLIGTQPPSPERPTLHFHAFDESEGYTHAAGFNICLSACYVYYRSWMSTLPDDPQALSDEEGVDGTYYYIGFTTENMVFLRGFGLDAPLPTDLAFGSGAVDATLTFTAQPDVEGDAMLRLYAFARSEECDTSDCMDQIFLGEGRAPLTATADGGSAHVSFVLDPAVNAVDLRGGTLAAEVIVEIPGPADAMAARFKELKFIPGKSSLTLPLVEPDEDASDLPSFINLYAAGAEEFVNPGKTRAFSVLVVNEGVEDSKVRLDLAAPDGWATQTQPAKRYGLAPGESVNVTVLVRAPTNATEGEKARIVVDAILEAADEEVKADSVRLTAIATEGIEIEDESTSFSTDPDATERALAEEGGDSPGFGLAAFAGAVALGLALHVRKRRP